MNLHWRLIKNIMIILAKHQIQKSIHLEQVVEHLNSITYSLYRNSQRPMYLFNQYFVTQYSEGTVYRISVF